MTNSFFSEKPPKDKIPFIAGGFIAGALGLWVFFRITEPYFAPTIKNVCRSYLGIDSSGTPFGSGGFENVEAARVDKGSITKRINTVGVLRANAEVMLKSETANRVKAINFKEGETVTQGDLLIQFEDADAFAELESAKAEFEAKKAAFERESKLRNVKLGAGKNYDEAKGNYDSTKARVDKAQATLDKTKVIAPFSGTIGIIRVDVGEYVQANTDLVKLVDNTPIKLDFKIPEKKLHEVGVGQIAEVKIDGFPGQVFSATVDAIDSAADAATHSIAIRAIIPNESGELRSGLYANISLIVGEKTDALTIPESAIIRDGDIEYVWVIVKDNQVGLQRVITGTRESAKVEILKGLPEGTLIVTSGQMKLGGGKRVNITNMPKPEDLLKDTPGASKDPSLLDKIMGNGEEKKPEEKKESSENINSSTEEKQDSSEDNKDSDSDFPTNEGTDSAPITTDDNTE